ncbi:PAAR domain-containing protein [Vibrio penaeicida]|uniref:PAAR domain-containing protein n=1 Tax=Vibrio penaeicida TaxID=104609 RepID=UPI002732CBE8|nr:PAAR domain-containing protein [Vibrio penaeicida]MDP2574960.1 PAAR domain-containing protein [Vibrio penaeicida]
MGKPAARVGDSHSCPDKTGKIPHVGGPISSGSGNVFIGGMPAARQGDSMVCVGPPDSISGGSGSVFINGKPAARMGDGSSHGGVIISGCGTVLIGDQGSPSSGGGSSSSSGKKGSPPESSSNEAPAPSNWAPVATLVTQGVNENLTLDSIPKSSTSPADFENQATVEEEKEPGIGLAMKDQNGYVYANKKVVIESGSSTVDAQTNHSGVLDLEEFKDEKEVTIKFWLNEEDEENFDVYKVSIKTLKPLSDTEGVQQRLANQGMASGNSDGQLGPKTQSDIKNLQFIQGLPLTGSIDGDTQEWLEKNEKLS